MKIIILAFVLLLSGCGVAPVIPEAPVIPVVPEKQTVQIQESLLAPCTPIVSPQAVAALGPLTQQEVVVWVQGIIGAFDACSASKASLVTTLRHAFNLATPAPMLQVPSQIPAPEPIAANKP